MWSGWERLTGNCVDEPSKELKYLAGQYDAMMCRPGYVGGEDSEIMDFEKTCNEAGRLKSLGNVPLLVISRDPDQESEKMTEKISPTGAHGTENRRH